MVPRLWTVLLVVTAVYLSTLPARSAPPTCDPAWDRQIGAPRPGAAYPPFGPNGIVYAFALFDVGQGARVAAGGSFSFEGTSVSSVAQWDEQEWSPIGTGFIGVVRALAFFDDGSGPALYAGGSTTNFGNPPPPMLMRWDGIAWSEVAGGLEGSGRIVNALTVFDDGSGPALYAGGSFDLAGGSTTVSNIARWNGSTWSDVGGGVNVNMVVNDMHVADLGDGPALYVGGAFSTPGSGIAKWNGTQWSALGSGITFFGTPGVVYAIHSFDSGSGPSLYVGGEFTRAGGANVSNFAWWNGAEWSGLPSLGTNGRVNALGVFDDGDGSRLYAGGYFNTAGGIAANLVAKWGAAGWSALADPLTGSSALVKALVPEDGGFPGDPALYKGGGGGFSCPSGSASVSRWLARGQAIDFSIDTAPADDAVCEGEPVQFGPVNPCGNGPFTYQWRHESIDIPGANAASLQIAVTTTADAGSYDVVVSSGCAELTSWTADLQVGTLDVCPAIPDAPGPHPSGFDSNRYLRMSLPNAGPCCKSALRVRMVDLQTPDPVNYPCCPAPDFSAYESGPTCTDPQGCARWVGPPRSYLEVQDIPTFGTFNAARLQCTPYYHAWGQEGNFSVLGAEILPSSEYEIEALAVACAGDEDNCTLVSAPLTVRTARFGDIATPRNPPAPTAQPDALDISLLLTKFKAEVDAESNTIVQMQPNVPNPNMDVSGIDIGLCIDAFKGKAYPFSGPCPCPSLVTCGTTACTTSTQCSFLEVGATCVKTCIGGPDDGLSCTSTTNCRRCVGGTAAGRNCRSNPDCPGGTCDLTPVCSTTGFCRDRCERCSPP